MPHGYINVTTKSIMLKGNRINNHLNNYKKHL